MKNQIGIERFIGKIKKVKEKLEPFLNHYYLHNGKLCKLTKLNNDNYEYDFVEPLSQENFQIIKETWNDLKDCKDFFNEDLNKYFYRNFPNTFERKILINIDELREKMKKPRGKIKKWKTK